MWEGGFRGNKAGHRREGAQTRDDKPPDGERNGEKRLQAGSLVPNSPRVGSEGQTRREQRWGAGPSGTPLVSWAPREETGVHIGPAPLDRSQHLRGHGSWLCSWAAANTRHPRRWAGRQLSSRNAPDASGGRLMSPRCPWPCSHLARHSYRNTIVSYG